MANGGRVLTMVVHNFPKDLKEKYLNISMASGLLLTILLVVVHNFLKGLKVRY
jgi:hypothetical protein